MQDGFFVDPHDQVSREVEDKDVKRVMADAIKMVEYCNKPAGIYKGGYAIAHPQITDKDPLRFFVLQTGQVIINPVMSNFTRAKILLREGCLSFPRRMMVGVERHYKCEVKCQTIEDGKLSDPVIWVIKGRQAQIAQHEIDHLNAKYIYERSVKT